VEILAKIGEFLKLKPQHMAAVCLVSASLLFLPNSWLAKIGVDTFARQQKAYLGIALLLSLSLFLCSWIAAAHEKVGWRRKMARASSAMKDYVQVMSPDEKGILLLYVAQQKKALPLPARSPAVQALQSQGFIYFTGLD
jgi:hypothetical protein